jgi:hypothetical protein
MGGVFGWLLDGFWNAFTFMRWMAHHKRFQKASKKLCQFFPAKNPFSKIKQNWREKYLLCK